MPLFDLFKKKPQPQAVKTSSKEIPLPYDINAHFTPEKQKKRYEAAMEFLGPLQKRFVAENGSAHAGTVLSAGAWLAGTSLYRSFNYKNDVAPGMVVLSLLADQEYPKLLNVFSAFCKRNGIDVMARPLVTQFPEKDKPQLKIEQVREEFQDQYHEIMQKYGLDYLDEAMAGMVVCSIVFQHHVTVVKDIDPYIATGLVAMGVVEGAKTAPAPLK
jgi:hypothetical protein